MPITWPARFLGGSATPRATIVSAWAGKALVVGRGVVASSLEAVSAREHEDAVPGDPAAVFAQIAPERTVVEFVQWTAMIAERFLDSSRP